MSVKTSLYLFKVVVISRAGEKIPSSQYSVVKASLPAALRAFNPWFQKQREINTHYTVTCLVGNEQVWQWHFLPGKK